MATTIGQILRYHRWPAAGTGSHGYDCPGYGHLYVDFSAASYDWGRMPEGSLAAYNNEVSTLLYHLGVALEMEY